MFLEFLVESREGEKSYNVGCKLMDNKGSIDSRKKLVVEAVLGAGRFKRNTIICNLKKVVENPFHPS